MDKLRVIEIRTGKTVGYVVGKTLDQELVVQVGTRTKLIPVNDKTNSKYKVERVQFTIGVK